MNENKDIQKNEAEESEEKEQVKEPAASTDNSSEEEEKIDVFTSPEQDEREDEADLGRLRSLIDQKNVTELRKFVHEKDPIDVAYLLNDIDDDNALVFFFKAVPNEDSAPVFSYLDQDEQEEIVKAFSSKDVQSFIADMPNDDLADFVEELPSNLVSKVLAGTSPEDRKAVNALLNYKEDTAGSIMTTEYVSIREGMTAEEAMAHIKEVGKEAETIVTTFVIDASRKLVGSLSLEDLVFADKDKKVDDIMDGSAVSVMADTDQEDVASLMKKYDLSVIPVIDKEQRMLGIITIDDVLDVVEAEHTEDIAHMAGVQPVQDDYLKTSVFKLSKSRIPWLIFLLLSDTLSCFILNNFDKRLALIPVLTSFVPMLTDMGGNAGGQTTTVVTRAISLKQVTSHDFWKVVWKEFRVSLVVSGIVAIVNYAWMMIELSTGIITNMSPDGGPGAYPNWEIALVVTVTGFVVIVLSKVIGAMLPVTALKLHIDPAIMAGPVVTSIVDSGALAIYLGISMLILNRMM